MLARSLPPERANREKLFRAAVKRSAAAGAGTGGREGAGGTGPGDGVPGGPALAGDPPPDVLDASPPLSQLGTSGVLPPGPRYALDVPISGGFPVSVYAGQRLLSLSRNDYRLYSRLQAVVRDAESSPHF